MKRKTTVLITCATLLLSLLIVYVFIASMNSTIMTIQPRPEQTPHVDNQVSPEPYTGQSIAVSDAFTVTVPNGWRGSVAADPSFQAILFARPGQIESLVYAADKPPVIDYTGITPWGGLTEHFYVRAITTPSQAFNSGRHVEVTSRPFTFSDGTIGTKYTITKHSNEAKKWGGLLKDSQWNGRVYEYKKDGRTVEAHLAFYPSTLIDESFFETVAKSIRL
jgi:hypothetical protein